MSENPTDEKCTAQTGEAWEEVGRQFQSLGESIAAAFRASAHTAENRQRLEEIRGGLEAMVKDVGQAIKEVSATPEAQQVKHEAGQTAEKLRTAGEETIQDVRPRLVIALRQLNDELQRMIERMEGKDRP